MPGCHEEVGVDLYDCLHGDLHGEGGERGVAGPGLQAPGQGQAKLEEGGREGGKEDFKQVLYNALFSPASPASAEFGTSPAEETRTPGL